MWVGANHVTSWSDVRALLVRTDGFYRPVVAATFALDRAVYGVAPFGFGVTNLILLLLGACRARVSGDHARSSRHDCGRRRRRVGAQLSRGEHGGAVVERSNRAVCRDRRVARRRCSSSAASRSLRASRRSGDAREGRSGDAAVDPEWMGMGPRGADTSASAVASSDVIRLTWPTWIALAIYFALRAQTAAMTPMTAHRVVSLRAVAGALAANALEYLDRACTFSRDRRDRRASDRLAAPGDDAGVRRVLVLGAIWFAGTFALTIFVPNRSSLYALLPSAAPALVGRVSVAAAWDVSSQQMARPDGRALRTSRGRGGGSSGAPAAGLLDPQRALDRDRRAVD